MHSGFLRQALFRPTGGFWFQVMAVAFILLSLAVVTEIVYVTGGTKLSWPYLMMLPIAVAAMVYKVPGGILVGAAAALLLGPYMPIDTDLNIPQTLHNWVLRVAFYMFIGGFIGALAGLLTFEQKRLARQDHIDDETGMLRARSFGLYADPSFEDLEASTISVIRLRNYADVQAVFGHETARQFAIQVFREFQNNLRDDDATLLSVDALSIGLVRPGTLHDGGDFLTEIVRAIPRRVSINNIPLPVSPCIGVSETHGTDLLEPASFDKALFACERAARDNRLVAAFDSVEHENRRDNLTLMDDLYRDLDTGAGLAMHYQPKLDLKSGAVSGAEALIRWNSPKHGFVPPDRFIPLAEQAGLIGDVTKWVIEQTVREFSGWRKDGIDINIAINLSANDLSEDHIIELLHTLPERLGADIGGIELELTETGLVKDFDAATEALRLLRRAGFKIAIDDFGSGYSSLEQFKRLPVDSVKIDKYFIQDLCNSEDSKQIVTAAVAMCRPRGIMTVAEGAEDDQTISLLRDLGCNYVQGYGIAKPMSAENFRTWMTHRVPESSRQAG